MRNFFTLFIFLFISISSWCQDSCSARLIPYSTGREPLDGTPVLRLSSSSGGQLYYFGAQHSNQPSHPQFIAIKNAFDECGPTLVFFEGPDRGVLATDATTIEKLGESGYTRFLAKTAGIKVMSLEPPPVALFRHLVSRYGRQKVELYFLLNETARLRTRLQMGREQIEQEVTTMIKKMQALAGDSMAINSIPALNNAFRTHWHNSLEWWQAPPEWFDPLKTSAESGGIFTNDINKLSSSFRNIHMYQILATQVNKGERVLAVIGRDHIVSQSAALECAIR